MNFKYSVFIAIIAVSLNSGAANAQGIYDKCMAAIEAGDDEVVKELAATVKRLKYPGVNADKAETCLEEAYGGDFVLDFSTGEFVDGDAAAALQKQKDERKNLLERKGTLREQQQCHQDKLNTIDKLYAANQLILENSNNKLVQELTVNACTDLHEKDPYDAILHPICRNIFLKNIHPDLDTTAELDTFNLLKEIKARSESEIARLENELVSLSKKGQEQEEQKPIANILEELLQPCD